jgi:O-antigen/teichoic acid export membrane protein
MIKQLLSFSYGSVCVAALSLLSTPIITLLVLPDEFGKASVFAIALNIVFQICLLGVDQSFSRMFYEKSGEGERAALARRCLTMALIATALVMCCFLPFWRYISSMLFDAEDLRAALLLAACLLLSVAGCFTTTAVKMHKRGHLLSIIQISATLSNFTITVVYALYVSPTFHAIVCGTAVSLFAHTAIPIIFERRFWARALAGALFDKAETARLLRYGLPLVPVFIIASLFQGMDKIALRAYSSFEEIGLYAAASKFAFLLTIMQTGFYLFWQPTSLERYEADRDDVRFFEKTFEYAAVAVLISAGLLLLMKDVVIYLLAPAYRSAVMIMPFLLLVPLMNLLSEITGSGIRFKKRTYLYIIVVAVGVAANFAGNYCLIPIFGARGAAISTGAAYTIYFVIQTLIASRLFAANYRIYKMIPAFLVILIFMALNTFYAVPWWCNAAPPAVVALMHWKVAAEVLRYLKSKLNPSAL